MLILLRKIRTAITLLSHPRIFKRHIIYKYGSHKRFSELRYETEYGRGVNWKNPEDLNQWIIKIEFEGDTSLWPILADKYAMRQYVQDLGLGKYLVPLLKVWDKPQDIDITTLPNRFVLKMNNGCGDIVIIKDKQNADINSIKTYFEEMFYRDFSRVNGEKHYSKIRPRIIAEQILDLNKQAIRSKSLIDYKVWCFNGKAKACFVVTNRTKNDFETGLYSCEPVWENIAEGNLNYDRSHLMQQVEVPKPLNFDLMIEIAQRISAGHPQMRVDFYEVDSKLYLGEITMTSAAGIMTYFTDSYLVKLGEYCKEEYFELKKSSNNV